MSKDSLPNVAVSINHERRQKVQTSDHVTIDAVAIWATLSNYKAD